MSAAVNITERQLWFGILKLALMLVVAVVLIVLGLSLLGDRGQPFAVVALLVAMTLTFLANGVSTVLRIVDWFAVRKGAALGKAGQ